MSTVTEADLREIKEAITGLSQRMETRFSELDRKIDGLDRKIDAVDKKLDIHIAKTDEHFKGLENRLNDTNKRIDDVNTRLNTITFGIFGVVGVFAGGMLTILSKFIPTGNP